MSNFCFAVLHAAVANIINLFIQPDAPQRFPKCGGDSQCCCCLALSWGTVLVRAEAWRALPFLALDKKSQVSQRRCMFWWLVSKFVGDTKPATEDAYGSLQLRYADFRPAFRLPRLPPKLTMRSKGRRDRSSPTCGLFFLCPGLGNIPAPSDATYLQFIY